MKTKQSWVLRIKCEIFKEVVTDVCTEAEARKHPWDHSIDERELDQLNWTVEDCRPHD